MTVLGREGELEAAGRLIGEPSSRLLADVRRMIIKDEVDRRMGWIGCVEKLEKLDELAAAVALLEQGVRLSGQQIDAGHQGDRAVSPVLMLARESRACPAPAANRVPSLRWPEYPASRRRR